MLKKWISFAVIVLVLAAIAFAGYRYWQHSQVHPNTEDAYVAGDVLAVSSSIPGRLLTVEITENQPVKNGQVVATIDPADYDAQVEQARAALGEARAALATNRAQIAQARAKADADASKLALARINLERFSELLQAQLGAQAALRRRGHRRAGRLRRRRRLAEGARRGGGQPRGRRRARQGGGERVSRPPS